MSEEASSAPESEATLTRRTFAGGLGVAAAGVAGALAGRAVGGDAANAPVQQTRRPCIVIDLDRCIGCSACAVACKSEHGVRLGGFRSWVSEQEVGHYPDVRRAFLPRLCNHCEPPPRLDVCPTGATHRRAAGAHEGGREPRRPHMPTSVSTHGRARALEVRTPRAR